MVINGIDVTADYWFRNGYVHSRNGFPTCNSTDPLSVDYWTITFLQGWNPPLEALDLIADLACQLALKCKNLPCQLDTNYQVISKGGAELIVIPPEDYRTAGLTGFRLLDDWIMLDRQGRATLKPKVARRRRSPMDMWS